LLASGDQVLVAAQGVKDGVLAEVDVVSFEEFGLDLWDIPVASEARRRSRHLVKVASFARSPIQEKTSQPRSHQGRVRANSAAGLRGSPRWGQAGSEECARRQTSSTGPCRVWMRWKR
jgi:hypothetical protein